MVGTDHPRVLRRHRGPRLHRLRQPRSGWPIAARSARCCSASCTSSTTTCSRCPTGTPGTVWFKTATAVRVLQGPGQDGGGALARRHDEHGRRRRLRRRRRLPLPHRPRDVHDHLRRRQHLPAGVREPVDHPSRRWPTRRCSACPTPTSARRSRRSCSRCPAFEPGPELARELIAFCRAAPRPPEVPALDRLRGRIAAAADRQAVQAPAARPLLGGQAQPYRLRTGLRGD